MDMSENCPCCGGGLDGNGDCPLYCQGTIVNERCELHTIMLATGWEDEAADPELEALLDEEESIAREGIKMDTTTREDILGDKIARLEASNKAALKWAIGTTAEMAKMQNQIRLLDELTTSLLNSVVMLTNIVTREG